MGISDRVRPFRGLRHSAITNDAASGMKDVALVTKDGHTDFKTTKGYIHLAGRGFREEAERAVRRKFELARRAAAASSNQ